MWVKERRTETRGEVMRKNGQDDGWEKQGTFKQAVKMPEHSTEAE